MHVSGGDGLLHDDRGEGQELGALARLDAEFDVGIHAGLERAVGVGEDGFDQHGLAGVLEHARDTRELRLVRLGARGFGEDAHVLAGLGEAGFVLRQGGLHAYGR